MDYSFIPFVLIVISLGVLIGIIIRKFPQLSLLDVENLPEVKEENKKNEFIKKRAEKQAAEAEKMLRMVVLLPVIDRFKAFQSRFRQLVGNIERKAAARVQQEQRKKPLAAQFEQVSEIKSMIDEARSAFERGDYETAERKYITVIRFDARNGDAYQGLGDVYAAQGQKKEAKETYAFLLQLYPGSEHALLQLATIAEEEGNLEEAINYYQQAVLVNDHKAPRFLKIASLLRDLGQYETSLEAVRQAVELESENPKYLDFLAEVSILVGDKKLAEEAYQQLRRVNPDNQKLTMLRDKIDHLL